MPRSNVDLPHALAPTMQVTWRSGMSVVSSCTTGSAPYPSVTALAASRLSPPARSLSSVSDGGFITTSSRCGPWPGATAGTVPRGHL